MSTGRAPRTEMGGTPSMGRERNLGRRRALVAWRWVLDAEGLGEAYLTLARKLPSMLQVSGLGQSLAFLYGKGYERGRAKSGKAEGKLLDQLAAYLQETQNRQPADPMETLLSLKPDEYRAASREMAATAEWLKRFAEGKLG